MSIPAAMVRRWRQARWRALLTPVLLALAPLLALTWAWPQGWPMAVLAGLAALAWGGWCARRLDRHWLALQLDARVPELEDSSGLLLGLEAPRSGLAQAQMVRLHARLPSLILPDLRAAWPWRATLASGLLAVALALLLTYWPSAEAPIEAKAPAVADPPAAVSKPVWRAFTLSIEPPAYTGLPLSRSDGPVASAPAGSTLRWQWQLAGPDQCQQCDVRLRFHDDSELPLQRDTEGLWSAERALPEDTYYRLLVDGQPLARPDGDSGPWRLHAVADQPPQIRVIEPTRTLTVLEQAQGQWPLQFEVSDDYGLGEAELQITLAQGSGEQITVAERRQRLRGEGDLRQRSYRQRLDPAALGFAQGDDLIIRLQVADRAQPQPQRSVSASYILRWPARQAAEASGVEVSVQKAMPAYFRSQRQIIIDTEALIAARFSPPAGQAPLSADEFAERADLLGVDQRILRLRYGQFLGEEAEGAPSSELQGRVAALREDGDDHDDHDDHEAHDEREDRSAAADQHAGHDHGEGGADEGDGGFGSAISVLEEYGHTHDDAEATTLFDPATRALLRSALNAMWQSELALRQAQPRDSLPHQYRALDYIKQVQQASRIYLARVGLELPPIDPSRRLSGEAKGLARATDRLQVAQADDPVPAWWAASAEGSAPTTEQLAQLRAWLDQAPATGDPLSLLAAAERWSADPECRPCQRDYQHALWPLLRLPPTRPALRARQDAVGASYLQRLERLDASAAEVP